VVGRVGDTDFTDFNAFARLPNAVERTDEVPNLLAVDKARRSRSVVEDFALGLVVEPAVGVRDGRDCLPFAAERDTAGPVLDVDDDALPSSGSGMTFVPDVTNLTIGVLLN